MLLRIVKLPKAWYQQYGWCDDMAKFFDFLLAFCLICTKASGDDGGVFKRVSAIFIEFQNMSEFNIKLLSSLDS